MQGTTKRELLTALQYFLIGVIAQGVVLVWFNDRPIRQKMLVWIVVAIGISIARFLILGVSGLYKRNQWMSVSRRNW
ncbi:MAG: hypothetical protein ACREEM_08190 [Blastocatellia bacterium]